jgi:biopolymer transport protein ExbD
MASQLGGQDDEPIAAINVVPLVDIILVVLIIFMVTAPLVLKPTIDVNLPKASSGGESPASPLNIGISQSGEVSINGRVANLTQIAATVAAIIAEKPETPAILQADKSVTLERLTEIIDTVKSAGVKKVAFAIERK